MACCLVGTKPLSEPTRTPAFWGYPPPPNDYPYHWVILDPKSKRNKVKVTNSKNSPKFQIFEFWNEHYTRHTFWSCLIRCANMKWIRWVLLKIQSGHDSVHRRTDGQGDTSFVEAGGIKNVTRDTPFNDSDNLCQHKRNPSRTVDATERTRFSKSRSNDLEDIGQGQR